MCAYALWTVPPPSPTTTTSITTNTTTAPRPSNRGMTESLSKPPGLSQEMQSGLPPRGPLQRPSNRLCPPSTPSPSTIFPADQGPPSKKPHFPLSQGALPCLTQPRPEWPRGRQGFFFFFSSEFGLSSVKSGVFGEGLSRCHLIKHEVGRKANRRGKFLR